MPMFHNDSTLPTPAFPGSHVVLDDDYVENTATREVAPLLCVRVRDEREIACPQQNK